MSRAARKPKTRAELEAMSLQQLNDELTYLRARRHHAGTSAVVKLFANEIAAAEAVRLKCIGTTDRRR
jgi:hypothetical protein